jgi:hypothetical protein
VSSPRNSSKLANKKNLPLFVLSPKSPKLSAHVERSDRTHNEEFYELHAESDEVPVLNRQLLRRKPTTACDLTGPCRTSLLSSSSPAGNATLERQSVTNLLDEYTSLTNPESSLKLISASFILLCPSGGTGRRASFRS